MLKDQTDLSHRHLKEEEKFEYTIGGINKSTKDKQ